MLPCICKVALLNRFAINLLHFFTTLWKALNPTPHFFKQTFSSTSERHSIQLEMDAFKVINVTEVTLLISTITFIKIEVKGQHSNECPVVSVYSIRVPIGKYQPIFKLWFQSCTQYYLGMHFTYYRFIV